MGYADRTKGSYGLHQRARRVLPAGVSYSIRSLPPHPFYVERAQGAKLYDVDGNVYTDYWMGHGALLLGHAPGAVVEAVKTQLPLGTHYGFSHPLEVEMAEQIVKHIPCAEMVRFTNSGTEANMYCLRLARAYTGRWGVVKVEGGWHGGYDGLHAYVSRPYGRVESAGLNPKAVEDVKAVPFNDVEAARRMVKDFKPACFILEPVMAAAGFITPEPGYLEALREICDEEGVLLVFDEVVTGFRMGLGGAQGYYGVKPDLSVLGKIMGGGFPVGAFCGPQEIMELIDHEKHSEPEERSAHGGTFTANPISMAAGLATIKTLLDGRVYRHVNGLGERIRRGLDDIFQGSQLEASVTGVGSMFAVHFQANPPKSAGEAAKGDVEAARAYFTHMLEHNIVYLTPTVCHCWVSNAHSEEDVEEFLSATEEFVKGYRG